MKLYIWVLFLLDMRLTRAIETTTSSISVIQQWQRLSQYLGVREKTISDIASSGHDNQWKCQAMLSEWRKSEPRRGQRKLVQSLRQVGCNCVAGNISYIWMQFFSQMALNYGEITGSLINV